MFNWLTFNNRCDLVLQKSLRIHYYFNMAIRRVLVKTRRRRDQTIYIKPLIRTPPPLRGGERRAGEKAKPRAFGNARGGEKIFLAFEGLYRRYEHSYYPTAKIAKVFKRYFVYLIVLQ